MAARLLHECILTNLPLVEHYRNLMKRMDTQCSLGLSRGGGDNNNGTTNNDGNNNDGTNNNGKLRILITCTKSDSKGAKNWRRIRLRLRSELEALRKRDTNLLSAATAAAAAAAAATNDNDNDTVGVGVSMTASSSSYSSSKNNNTKMQPNDIYYDPEDEEQSPVVLRFVSLSVVKGLGVGSVRGFVEDGLDPPGCAPVVTMTSTGAGAGGLSGGTAGTGLRRRY